MNLMRFLLLFFPLILPASPLSHHYTESFVHHFQRGEFSESIQTLEEWTFFEPEQENKIIGMKAAVYFSNGDFENGKIFMDNFIQGLSPEELSDPMMNLVLQLYYNALPNPSIELPCVKKIAQFSKQEQPKGVKLKYWFGVGQVLAGILAAPFSVGTSTALILSGAAIVVDAASDALNNMENWERELNERQRMNPEIQRNSFFLKDSEPRFFSSDENRKFAAKLKAKTRFFRLFRYNRFFC